MNKTSETSADVLIIGGGAAGLSASIALARSLRTVVLIDAGDPRNAAADGAHNVLAREGMKPTEILAHGRAEALDVGVQIIDAYVEELTGELGNFTATTSTGETVTATRVVLATGLTDVMPDIDGIEKIWGKKALHCPYCHGYEIRGQKLAVLQTSPMGWHQALLFAQLTPNITYYYSAPLADEHRAALERTGVELIEDTARAVTEDADGQVHVSFASGNEVTVDAVAIATTWEVNSSLYEKLGGTLTDSPMGMHIAVDAMGKTEVPGVWAAGNVRNLASMVQTASAEGIAVGAAINMEMVFEKAGL